MTLTIEGARIEVPMDHSNPSIEKNFSIPLIRMFGTNTSANGDKTIMFNPGGPGGIIPCVVWMKLISPR
jgi:hypothetical protein